MRLLAQEQQRDGALSVAMQHALVATITCNLCPRAGCTQTPRTHGTTAMFAPYTSVRDRQRGAMRARRLALGTLPRTSYYGCPRTRRYRGSAYRQRPEHIAAH